MGKRSIRAVVAGLLALGLAVPAALAGASESRQTAKLSFTAKQPRSSTGASILIDYINPDDPAAKPFGVDRVDTIFHPGTVIDTSVPARCTVAQAGGPQETCPEGSEVGGGILHLDQGDGGPGTALLPRKLKFRATLFNGPEQLIFRLDGTNNQIRGFVAPAEQINARTFRNEVPPLPGGPPDNQVAIDLIDVDIDRVSNARGNYITTPPSCPSGGDWTNRVTFSYNDDQDPQFEVVQSPTTASACVRASGVRGGVTGTAGDDVLTGTPGDDVIRCGAGDDRVDARGGDDVVFCGSGRDVVRGGAGEDRLHGESGNDEVFGESGDDLLVGGSGRDRLVGGSGDDRLDGGSGRDSISQ